jgi:predicted DNA-binding protein
MPAARTQIYLSEEQRRRIDRVAKSQGLTMAEVVRQAVDAYVGDEPDPTAALAATFGADPQAEMPTRDDWDRG